MPMWLVSFGGLTVSTSLASQTITTSATAGYTIGGSFYLALDTSSTGGSLQYSGE